ncbi:COG4223 family protein [Caulobacter sp. RL271]|jgi:hypothetical protein|uniref:Uncharacterized protein n=1 Tax=Caulobacter segnis TaxID=88688 RepID=A0ABY4ZTR7_9CAUL|nr:hypothetical protein [Caulobacter segnis]USQ95905.1 hypothetical protein MZV50_25780 [Caulobacter segnis]
MNAAPDPAEIVAPSDPALYARRRVMGPGVWIWLLLCVLCIGLGAAVAHYGPTLFAPKARPAAGAVSATPSPRPVADRVAAGSALPVESGATAEAPPAADVERFDGRISALESSQKGVTDAATAALAVSALAETADTSRPFAPELAGLQRVLPPSPDLRALEALSERGAPTRAGLAVQFVNLAGRAASAARDPGPEADLFSRIRYALSRIVSIRHVGSTTGSTPDAMLARAQALLDDGDVEGAVLALDLLPDTAREVLAPWFNAANRRIEIDRHIAAIRADALAGLSRVSRAERPAEPPVTPQVAP